MITIREEIDIGSSIKLISIGECNPFAKYPQIKEIWTLERREKIEKNCLECLKNLIYLWFNRIYLIQLNNEIVGITGFYSSLYSTRVQLFWHGIVPYMKGLGISSYVLGAVMNEAQKIHKKAYLLSELVPSTQLDEVSNYFFKLGFKFNGKSIWVGEDFNESWYPMTMEMSEENKFCLQSKWLKK